MEIESDWYVHIDDESRLDGVMPAYISNERIDEQGDVVVEQRENVSEGNLEDGWFAWPFNEEPPEDFTDYLFIEGELQYLEREPTEEEIRGVDITEAYSELPEIRDGLLEVANLAASNEATLDDVVTALMELAEIVGGE